MLITQELIDRAVTKKPYFRTVRQLFDGSYSNNGFMAYIKDPSFAPGADDDIRSFLIIQKRFIEILEYVEPAEDNEKTYSLQLRNLLMMICTEVEANLKSIMKSNGYTKQGFTPKDWTMKDYRKVNQSHRLSEYKVYLPYWKGSNMRQPFKNWNSKKDNLTWYKAYNDTKHSRGDNLSEANLGNVVEAMSGLMALISAQYYTINPSEPDYLIAEMGYSNHEHAIGNYFSVEFPDFPIEERYNLDITYTNNEPHKFQEYNYI